MHGRKVNAAPVCASDCRVNVHTSALCSGSTLLVLMWSCELTTVMECTSETRSKLKPTTFQSRSGEDNGTFPPLVFTSSSAQRNTCSSLAHRAVCQTRLIDHHISGRERQECTQDACHGLALLSKLSALGTEIVTGGRRGCSPARELCSRE